MTNEEAPMFDLLSTLFPEVQRESQRGMIGRQAHDRQTYEVLHGTGAERPAQRQRQFRVALAVSFIIAATVMLVWLALL